MRSILVAMRDMRKSQRVADENMFLGARLPIIAQNTGRMRHGQNGFTVILRSILRAPLLLLSCLSHPRMNGADGVWTSEELARISEMNHLMVRESMRYAILM